MNKLVKHLFLPGLILLAAGSSAWAQINFPPQADTSDLFKTTADKVVRGMHYNNLFAGLCSPKLVVCDSEQEGQATSHSAIDLFFETNWFTSSKPKVLGDFLDDVVLDAVVNDDNISTLLQNVATGVEFDEIISLAKEITMQDFSVGSMVRLNTTLDSVKVGIDIPVVGKFSHIWTSKDNQAKLKSLIAGISDVNDDDVADFSSAETAKIESLVTRLVKEFGCGDLRLYAEKDFWSAPEVEFVLGAEALVPTTRPETKIHGDLHLRRRDQFDVAAANDLVDSFTNEKAKKASFKVIKNLLNTLHQGKLKSQIDQLRAGLGLYAKPIYVIKPGLMEVFGLAKFDYLFGVQKTTVLPIENSTQIETSEFKTQMSPTHIVHSNIGLAYYPGNFDLKAGYDFYHKTEEQIIKIEDTTDASGTDIEQFLEKQKGEIPRSTQHRVFGAAGYHFACNDYTLTTGISGHYNFHTSGNTNKDWGIALSAGTVF